MKMPANRIVMTRDEFNKWLDHKEKLYGWDKTMWPYSAIVDLNRIDVKPEKPKAKQLALPVL
jgi:phage antirepressor YoqD-like protein